jgi:ABC-type multidrug transport system fused ATPase/permease subunit
MKKIKKLIIDLKKSIRYCFDISWAISKYYFLIRLIGKTLIPINVVFMSVVLKDIINKLADSISKGNTLNKSLIILIILSCGLRLINTIFSSIIEYVTDIQSNLLEKYINTEIIKTATKSDLELFDNSTYYNKMLYAQRNFQSITVILWSVIDSISSIVSLIIIMILFSRYNIWLGIIMVLICVPSAVSRKKFTKLLYSLELDQLKKERQKQYLVNVAMTKTYAQTVRLYNMGNMLKNKYLFYWKSNYTMRKKILKSKTLITCIFQLLPEIAILLITLNIANSIVKGLGTLGDYSLYIGLISQMWSCLVTLTGAIDRLYQDQLKINSIMTFNQIPKSVIDSGIHELKEIITIEFIDVKFMYPNSENYILDGVNFKINHGEKVAIVGINGAGKSTLIKLLLRFYDVTEGVIAINNRNIKDYSLQSVRNKFSTYFQDEANFAFTIKENITLSDLFEKSNDKKIMSAIRSSQADSFINKEVNGLDANLYKIFDEGGIELSGGQNQKLALARSFYRNSQCLILDEPSSSLDPEAEYKLFDIFGELCKGKTVLYTTHRLVNISFADRIIVLEKGYVIEEGTKDELLKNPKRFAELYNYYIEGV